MKFQQKEKKFENEISLVQKKTQITELNKLCNQVYFIEEKQCN